MFRKSVHHDGRLCIVCVELKNFYLFVFCSIIIIYRFAIICLLRVWECAGEGLAWVL